jgi:hypothetical protein
MERHRTAAILEMEIFVRVCCPVAGDWLDSCFGGSGTGMAHGGPTGIMVPAVGTAAE